MFKELLVNIVIFACLSKFSLIGSFDDWYWLFNGLFSPLGMVSRTPISQWPVSLRERQMTRRSQGRWPVPWRGWRQTTTLAPPLMKTVHWGRPQAPPPSPYPSTAPHTRWTLWTLVYGNIWCFSPSADAFIQSGLCREPSKHKINIGLQNICCTRFIKDTFCLKGCWLYLEYYSLYYQVIKQGSASASWLIFQTNCSFEQGFVIEELPNCWNKGHQRPFS